MASANLILPAPCEVNCIDTPLPDRYLGRLPAMEEFETMAWNHKTRVVAMAVAIQTAPGVFTAPGVLDIIPCSPPTNGEDVVSADDPTATGSVWAAPRIYLGKTGNVGATIPLRGPGGTAPFAAGAWPTGRILMAAGFAEARIPAAITGTLQAGGSTTALALAAAAAGTDDYYVGMPITHAAIGTGPVKGVALISDYNGTSKLASIAETMGTAPSSGTYTILPNVTYQLGTLTETPPILSVSVWRDKKRYDYRDVRIESLTIDMPVANEQNQVFPSIEFAMKGIPAGVSDDTAPALSASNLTAIAPYRNGKFTLDRVNLGHQSTQFQISADVAGASNAMAAPGQDGYEVMSGERSLALDLNQMAKSDFDIDARVDAQIVLPCMSIWGMGPGNRFGFCVPEVVLDPLNNPGDRNGFVNLTGNAVFQGVDKSATLTIWWADDAVAPAPTLNALSITPNTAQAGQPVSIAISGATAGSTITGTVPAGLSINSGLRTITGTPTGASTVAIALTETLAGATNNPRANSLAFTVSAAAANLGALTLNPAAAQVGGATTINILGATAGSTITGTVPAGMTLNSAARTITGTPTTASNTAITLTEALAGAANTPNASTIPFTVAAAANPPTFALTGSSTMEKYVTDYTGTSNAGVTRSSNGTTWATSNTGLGAITLGNRLNDALGQPIRLLTFGVGGSSIKEWDDNATGKTYRSNFVTAALAAGGVDAVFLVCGFNDAKQGLIPDVATHVARLRSLISKMRTELGQPNLKIIIGFSQNDYSSGASANDVYFDRLHAAEQAVVEVDANVFFGANSWDLSQLADGIHQTETATPVHATRLADNAIKALAGQSTDVGPTITGITGLTYTTTEVTITHDGGTDITPTTGIGGFAVKAGASLLAIAAADRTGTTKVLLTHANNAGVPVTVTYEAGASPVKTPPLRDNSDHAGYGQPASHLSLGITAASAGTPVAAVKSAQVNFRSVTTTRVNTTNPAGWNALTAQEDAANSDVGATSTTGMVSNLLTPDGSATGWTLTTTTASRGASNNVMTGTQTMPADVANSWWANGDSGTSPANARIATTTHTFTGLDPSKTYKLGFYGRRETTTARQTKYSAGGQSVTASNNQNNGGLTEITGLAPNSSGVLTYTYEPAGTAAFGYLSAVVITELGTPTATSIAMVDFTRTGKTSPAGYNAWVAPDAGGAWTAGTVVTKALVDTAGVGTGWSIANTADPAGVSDTGNSTGTNAVFATDARATQVYIAQPGTMSFKISGLNPAKTYDLTCYGSRLTAAGPRRTNYTAVGSNTVTGFIADVIDNITTNAVLASCQPNGDGEIVLSFAADQASSQFGYLNCLRIAQN